MPLPTLPPALAQLVELQTHNPRVMGLPGEENIFRDDLYQVLKRSCSVAS